MTDDNIVAFIDIGSAETKVLIAELFPQINIVGNFTGKTRGMSKGEIIDIKELKESVHSVIQGAEKNAGAAVQIRRAVLAISSRDTDGKQMIGLTGVKATDSVVSREDMHTAQLDAYRQKVPEGRVIVHRLRQSFCLDSKPMNTPEGRTGKTLAYNMWVVDADKKYLSELIQIPNNYGLRVEEVFLASIASARAVATGSELDKNRLVIDIGAGTTDFVLYRDGVVSKTGVIPVGGGHITNDISSGLRTSTERAESLKISSGRAVVENEDVYGEIDLARAPEELPEFAEKISKYKLNCVISMRVAETFDLVKKALGDDAEISSVFLTGGTAGLAGIAQVAAGVFGQEVRLVEPNCPFASRSYSDRKFSTVVGMVDLFYQRRKEAAVAREKKTLWSRIATLFNH